MQRHPETGNRRAPGLAGRADGGVLPLALIVLSIMSLLSLQMLRTALSEAGLVRALQSAALAAGVARRNSRAALAAITADPALLPPATVSSRRSMPAARDPGGNARTEVVFLDSDGVCPRLPGRTVTRDHYEIISSTTTPQGAAHTEHQGFYVCREICSAPCTGTVTPPVASYWRTGRAP